MGCIISQDGTIQPINIPNLDFSLDDNQPSPNKQKNNRGKGQQNGQQQGGPMKVYPQQPQYHQGYGQNSQNPYQNYQQPPNNPYNQNMSYSQQPQVLYQQPMYQQPSYQQPVYNQQQGVYNQQPVQITQNQQPQFVNQQASISNQKSQYTTNVSTNPAQQGQKIKTSNSPPQQAPLINNTLVSVQSSKPVAPSQFPSQRQFLEMIKNFLFGCSQMSTILNQQFFSIVFTEYYSQYWSSDLRQQLINTLLSYINFTVSQLSTSQKNNTKYDLKNFSQIFGKTMYMLLNSVKIKNSWILQGLQYQNDYMSKKDMELVVKNTSIQDLFEDARHLCAKNTSSLVYISGYLTKCCSLLERNGRSVNQINQVLKPVIKHYKQLFSPQKTIEQEMKYNKRSFQKQLNDEIKSEKKDYKKKILVFKTSDKQQEIGNLIMEMVEMAKKNYSSFTALTSSCCLQNEGFAYKSNLKLKDRSQQMAFLRVKQKLLGDQIANFYKNKTYNCRTISQQKAAQIAYLEGCLKEVYSKMDQIQFNVMDLLRGKCMFNKVAHINAAAKAIMKKVSERASKGQKIEIVEIDNRLMKITTDLVLKIKMDELVCEFQIALKFNQAQNEIHHKMYEVQRSKVFTPVIMLFNWHQKICQQFFSSVQKIISQKKLDANTGRKFNYPQILERLKRQMNYLPKKSGSSNDVQISKKQYQQFVRISREVKNMANNSKISNYSFLRSGKCLNQMKKFKPSVEHLSRFLQNNMSHSEAIAILSDSFKRLANYKQAKKYIQYYINLMRTEKQLQQCKDEINQAYSDYIQTLIQMRFYKVAMGFLNSAYQKFVSKYFGPNSKQYARYLSNLAFTKTKENDDNALQNFQNSIKTFEKCQKYLQDPEYPKVFIRFSEYQSKNSRFSKSLELLNKALSISQTQYGKQSLQAAEIIIKIGGVYQQMAKFQQAQQHYKKYSTIALSLTSRLSMQFATYLFYLSNLYMVTGKTEQSKKLLKQCKYIIKTIQGTDTHEYMQALNLEALLQLQSGNFQQAIDLLEVCKNTIDQIFKQQNNETAAIYISMAIAYTGLIDFQSAYSCYMMAILIIINIFGQQHIQVAFAVYTYGLHLFQRQSYEQALSVFLKSRQIYEQVQFQSNKNYYQLLFNIAECYRYLGFQKKYFQYLSYNDEKLKQSFGEQSVKYQQVNLQLYQRLKNSKVLSKQQSIQILNVALKVYRKQKMLEKIKYVQGLLQEVNNKKFPQNLNQLNFEQKQGYPETVWDLQGQMQKLKG